METQLKVDTFNFYPVFLTFTRQFKILTENINNKLLKGFEALSLLLFWYCVIINSCSVSLEKSSDSSSTKPRVYLVRLCSTSRQWILSPLAMGRSKLTIANMLGLWMPRGGSRLLMKSDIWLKVINWVACGSYLDHLP